MGRVSRCGDVVGDDAVSIIRGDCGIEGEPDDSPLSPLGGCGMLVSIALIFLWAISR